MRMKFLLAAVGAVSFMTISVPQADAYTYRPTYRPTTTYRAPVVRSVPRTTYRTTTRTYRTPSVRRSVSTPRTTTRTRTYTNRSVSRGTRAVTRTHGVRSNFVHRTSPLMRHHRVAGIGRVYSGRLPWRTRLWHYRPARYVGGVVLAGVGPYYYYRSTVTPVLIPDGDAAFDVEEFIRSLAEDGSMDSPGDSPDMQTSEAAPEDD